MKKVMYYFGSVIVVALVTLIILYRTSTQNTKITNAEFEALYESVSDQPVGFYSDAYSVTDYTADRRMILKTGVGPTFISDIVLEDGKTHREYDSEAGRGVYVSSLGKTIRLCYGRKPFFQISNNYFGKSVPIRLALNETTINGKSFVVISGQYDIYGDIGGVYVNGQLISQRIILQSGAPFVPRIVKKVGKKIIIKFMSADYASLYALFNEEAGSLILPVDAEEVENNHESMKKYFQKLEDKLMDN